MNKATLERIMNPGVKWIVYLYVIPHYGHNPELREAIRKAGGIRKIGIYILEEVDDAVTAGRLEAYYVNEVYHCVYDPYHPETCYGYNRQTGGLTGFSLCQYSRDLIAKSKSVPVLQAAKDEDKVIALYASMKIAEDISDIAWENISRATRSAAYTAGGFRWFKLSPYLSPEQIEKIFYRDNIAGLILPFSLSVIFADAAKKLDSKHEAAGENPAAVLLPEGGEQA